MSDPIDARRTILLRQQSGRVEDLSRCGTNEHVARQVTPAHHASAVDEKLGWPCAFHLIRNVVLANDLHLRIGQERKGVTGLGVSCRDTSGGSMLIATGRMPAAVSRVRFCSMVWNSELHARHPACM